MIQTLILNYELMLEKQKSEQKRKSAKYKICFICTFVHELLEPFIYLRNI
jgi:hypothetical protein